MKIQRFCIVVLFICALISFGCKTTPKLGSLIGTVTLLNDTGDSNYDPVDYSGVSVAIYQKAILDTTLVRLNDTYPQIGSPVCQQTDFDHRDSNPLYQTTTAGDGSFSIQDIEPGTYNVALLKENWGVRYYYEVEIQQDEKRNLGTVTLYPVLDYSATVLGETTFYSDHTYVVTDIANFISAVTIEPRARIYMAAGSSVKVFGEVHTSPSIDIRDAWKFLAEEGMYSTVPTSITSSEYYTSVEFYHSPVNLNNGVFFHVANNVATIADISELSNIVIRKCGAGLAIAQGTASINNLTVGDGINYGVNVNSMSSGQTVISNSIIKNMADGVKFNITGTFDVNNSYFQNNYNAVVAMSCTGSITHNCFYYNYFDVAQSMVPINTDISYNNFYLSRIYGVLPSKHALINNNNFYRTNGNFITIFAPGFPPNNSYVTSDLNATLNYWGVSNVDDYILDANDNASYPDDPCAFHVIYLPRRNGIVSSAGIQ
jgi:hypothetical protein